MLPSASGSDFYPQTYIAAAAASSSTHPQDTRTTVEEVEDEDDADAHSASRKKKKKKPKKKKTRYPDMDLPALPEDVPASPVVSPVSSPTTSPTKAQPTRKTSLNNSTSSILNMSAVSLPLTGQTTAHSGHSYLQEVVQKEKIKSRPDHASLFSRGFLPRGNDKTKDIEESNEDVNKKHTWFSRLGKKTTGYMQQLLRVDENDRRGAMKWENFLKVLRAYTDLEEIFMRVHR